MEVKKNDRMLILLVLAVGIAACGAISWYSGTNTKRPEAVVITAGKEYGRYLLSRDCQVEIRQDNGGCNMLVIENGTARMEEASCPDKICVNQGAIYKKGETIVCLPNQVTVEVRNGEEKDVDFSTH